MRCLLIRQRSFEEKPSVVSLTEDYWPSIVTIWTKRSEVCTVTSSRANIQKICSLSVSTRLISIFRVRFSCNVVTRHQSRLIRKNTYPLHYVQLSVYFDSLIYTAACRNKAAKDWPIRPTLNFLPSTWNSCRLHYIHSIYKLIDCTGCT